MAIQKRKVERAYNKKVKHKLFKEGDLVWKLVLPIGLKDRSLGKWSLNWEGLFFVIQVIRDCAYLLTDTDGTPHTRPINGKYLKAYFLSMWNDVDRLKF